MALTEFTKEIFTAIDNKHYLVSIFVDLEEAFNNRDHTILLNKLIRCGIRGVAHQWITSYLENRKQFDQINNIKSELWGTSGFGPWTKTVHFV